jgi:hypothetical protein
LGHTYNKQKASGTMLFKNFKKGQKTSDGLTLLSMTAVAGKFKPVKNKKMEQLSEGGDDNNG